MNTLRVATDIYDDFLEAGRLYTKQNLQDLMRYVRSLGASGIDWVYDDVWRFYDDYDAGFELLPTAIEAAHEVGLDFTAVYKPFEGAIAGPVLPHTAPRPDGAVVWEALQGLIPVVRPFAVAHPHLCMKRWPGDEDPGGALTEIRLVKSDDAPVTLHPEDVEIWTSDHNGRMTRFQCNVQVTDNVEWRPHFPLGRSVRVLKLRGMKIAASERFVKVRLAEGALGEAEFENDYDALVELVNERGEAIPATVAAASQPHDVYANRMAKSPLRDIVRYTQHPEVQAFLYDKSLLREQTRDLAVYGREPGNRSYALHHYGNVSVARGKDTYLRGILNPIYPEVRAEWLRTVRHLIDCGVDAVDFRASSHLSEQQPWAYGFNEPVMEQLGGQVNRFGAWRIMGEAYTSFLRDARDLLHTQDRKVGVHLLTNFERTRDQGMAKPSHEMMEWQWETWVNEIADFATIRGAMGMRRESLHAAVDKFAWVCQQRGIPLLYQANRRVHDQRLDATHMQPDRRKMLEYEMQYAAAHPAITGFQYYETAYFTELDRDGTFHGSEEMGQIARQFGFSQITSECS